MNKKLLLAFAATFIFASTANAQDSAVINFTTNLDAGGYSGLDALNPFIEGTEINQLVNGTGFFTGPGVRLDWLRFNGQIAIKNYTGDGTYTITPDGTGDGGIFLHSPLLNRIETETWRTEGGLSTASTNAGGGVFDGDPTQNRDDIYLPDFTPNGTATVTISNNGTDVSVDYFLDFNTLPFENSLFLRGGDTDTDISLALANANGRFRSIGVTGSGSATPTQAAIGTDDDDIPFGVYFNLDPTLDGNLSNTVADLDFFLADGDTLLDPVSGALTRGIIRNELAAGNITSDGMLGDSGTNTEILQDPFANESGTVFFFDLNGGSDFVTSIVTEAIPEPSATLFLVAGLCAFCSRRKKRIAHVSL